MLVAYMKIIGKEGRYLAVIHRNPHFTTNILGEKIWGKKINTEKTLILDQHYRDKIILKKPPQNVKTCTKRFQICQKQCWMVEFLS